MGRARLIDRSADPVLIVRLEMPHYRASIERAVIITVEGYDWNCPQHFTPRFTETEIEAVVAPLHAEIDRLRETLGPTEAARAPPELGAGPLALRSGKQFNVPPEQSILEAVEMAGVQTSSGWRGGTCGTCRAKVLDGEPEHRDVALSDAERGASGMMCICVSRAKSPDLILDL